MCGTPPEGQGYAPGIEAELAEELVREHGQAGAELLDYLGGPGFLEKLLTSK